jgi:hypothetical protein
MAEEILQNITRMPESQQLLADVCHIIDEARQNVAQAANSALTMMYWQIGNTIHNYTLDGQRAAYGQQIVSALSTQLTESPLGLLLCTEGSEEQIELLQLEDSSIKVAQYYTELPSKAVLQEQLRKQIEAARMRKEDEE